MKRRNFLQYSLLTSSLLLGKVSLAKDSFPLQKSKKIVICGAGYGGLSLAKYLKQLNPSLDVILIEKKNLFISCPLSNAFLGEIKEFTYESLCFDYNSAVFKYKYKFINETIIDIKRDKKMVITSKSKIPYDYLIMALGIDYNYKKLFKKDKVKAKEALYKAPPGLKPGSEHLKLKKMIEEFKGGNFILTLPSAQFKCPSAPYERACMIAHYFKTNKIKAKVIIIDPRAKPASKAKDFLSVYETMYKDYIEYKNFTNFKDVDFKKKILYVEVFDKKSLDYKINKISFEEISIIPANIANKLYKKAKIKTYAQGFVKLRRPTFRSVSDEDVYVIGDAQGEYPYPKSAQMANSQALLVARELINRIKNKSFDYKNNMPGNVCYSIVSENKAISISHFYNYKEKISVETISSEANSDTFLATKLWYKSLTNDIFGLKG